LAKYKRQDFMMRYAFDEFWPLVGGLPDNEALPYLGALIAELAYRHVPTFEFDAAKRAQLVVPSAAYRSIISGGAATNIEPALRDSDIQSFVVADRFVIAVGLAARDMLFVGFRGTVYLYDWRINLDAPLTPVASVFPTTLGSLLWPGTGRLHRGFTEEAVRIALKIRTEADKLGAPFKHVHLAGHSLGGAVAAIAEGLLTSVGDIKSTQIFGAPRYADTGHYYSRRTDPPIHFARKGDIVPAVPPRRMGYADHPRELDTNLNESVSGRQLRGAYFLWRSALFLAKRFKHHDIDGYRREIGNACGVKLADCELTDHRKLTDVKGA